MAQDLDYRKRQRVTEISSVAASVLSGAILLVIASFYNDVKQIPVVAYRVEQNEKRETQLDDRLSQLEKDIYAKTN